MEHLLLGGQPVPRLADGSHTTFLRNGRNEVNVMKGRTGSAAKDEPDAVRTDQAVRLSVNLNPEVSDELKEYAGRKGVSITEAVRRAISVLAFIDDAQARGASLNLEENGSLKEVLFLV